MSKGDASISCVHAVAATAFFFALFYPEPGARDVWFYRKYLLSAKKQESLLLYMNKFSGQNKKKLTNYEKMQEIRECNELCNALSGKILSINQDNKRSAIQRKANGEYKQ